MDEYPHSSPGHPSNRALISLSPVIQRTHLPFSSASFNSCKPLSSAPTSPPSQGPQRMDSLVPGPILLNHLHRRPLQTIHARRQHARRTSSPRRRSHPPRLPSALLLVPCITLCQLRLSPFRNGSQAVHNVTNGPGSR
jgi:hypothetical protein